MTTIDLVSTPFKYGKKYCQHDEENIILTVFEQIGHKGSLCDIGARMLFSNSRRLIEEYGYTGTLVDANPDAVTEMKRLVGDWPGIVCCCEKITIENVNNFVPDDVDFLNIDIDSNDWWVWAHVKARPRVVCVEFNPRRPEGLNICDYNADMARNNFGKWTQSASFDAFRVLGMLMGYSCIAKTGVNAIFLKNGSL